MISRGVPLGALSPGGDRSFRRASVTAAGDAHFAEQATRQRGQRLLAPVGVVRIADRSRPFSIDRTASAPGAILRISCRAVAESVDRE
jgi:hypothetical protein